MKEINKYDFLSMLTIKPKSMLERSFFKKFSNLLDYFCSLLMLKLFNHNYRVNLKRI